MKYEHEYKLVVHASRLGCALAICLCALVVWLALVGLLHIVTDASPAQAAPAANCVPPPNNFATWVPCHTQTAAAQSGQATPTSPTSTATRTPEPTLTPVDTPQPLLIRSDGSPFICEESYTWQNGDDWMFVLHCQRVPTMPAPTRIVP